MLSKNSGDVHLTECLSSVDNIMLVYKEVAKQNQTTSLIFYNTRMHAIINFALCPTFLDILMSKMWGKTFWLIRKGNEGYPILIFDELAQLLIYADNLILIYFVDGV